VGASHPSNLESDFFATDSLVCCIGADSPLMMRRCASVRGQRKGERGSAMVEYAIVLLFVGAVALGMSGKIVQFCQAEKLRNETSIARSAPVAFTQASF